MILIENNLALDDFPVGQADDGVLVTVGEVNHLAVSAPSQRKSHPQSEDGCKQFFIHGVVSLFDFHAVSRFAIVWNGCRRKVQP